MSTVSVIIPTYNRSDVLPRAIDSVLQQSYEDLELIVVDDASTDSTENVVRSYSDARITYIKHEENKNGSAARNTGIEAATGEYIALLDSDDEWHQEKLERQVAQLGGKSDEWVGSYCAVTVERGSKIKEFIAELFDNDASSEGQEDVIRDLLTLRGLMHGGSTLVARRESVESIGGFDESFERHQDIEFTVRLAKEGKIAHLDEELVTLHESGGPNTEAIADAKQKLFEKFPEDVEEIESKGYNVYKSHQFVLARHFIRTGNFKVGLKRLFGSRPSTTRHLVGLGLDIIRGVKGKITYIRNE